MAINYLLSEATEKSIDAKSHVADIKKIMNTCQLSKYKSDESCAKLYSAIFMCQLPNSNDTLTFAQWSEIYMTLLNDADFTKKLCYFIAMWQPKDYKGMFNPLIVTVESELAHMKENRVRLLSDAKALFRFINTTMDSVAETVKASTSDPEVIKFIVTVNQVTTNYIFYFDKLIKNETENNIDPDDTTIVIHTPITETKYEFEDDVKELFYLMEHAQEWIDDYIAKNYPEDLNEGIVNKTKEAAKMAVVKTQKAERAFEEFVTKKVRKLRENRRNRKHAEMVGEALRITHEIKRLLGSVGVAFITRGPFWGIMTWVISVVMERMTDRKDRAILVGQLKDELEIVDEKIQIAERNGDDKGKIELIRLRQKMQREYERITKVRFDKSNLQRLRMTDN